MSSSLLRRAGWALNVCVILGKDPLNYRLQTVLRDICGLNAQIKNDGTLSQGRKIICKLAHAGAL